ncbi:hypothetical protein IGI04_030355 [Brassica rapa subsp. trilocularis]|uniref:MADS-box domain-containing protein n=1 Tax=Brassica rapa subsp. trilocularis TaxID=1813537 RepID=A0ABQ7LTT2_BRACM|nr:hypothetical protein IGI04_030355 [Brassica rapa subsp. trilocularis]
MAEYQNEVRKEETSKKKRRLSAKKRKCRRRLVFAIITDIEFVAIYTCRRRPCFSFSDPFLPVFFTVVATTTTCHHTGHLSLFQSLSLFLCVLNLRRTSHGNWTAVAKEEDNNDLPALVIWKKHMVV